LIALNLIKSLLIIKVNHNINHNHNDNDWIWCDFYLFIKYY